MLEFYILTFIQRHLEDWKLKTTLKSSKLLQKRASQLELPASVELNLKCGVDLYIFFHIPIDINHLLYWILQVKQHKKDYLIIAPNFLKTSLVLVYKRPE